MCVLKILEMLLEFRKLFFGFKRIGCKMLTIVSLYEPADTFLANTISVFIELKSSIFKKFHISQGIRKWNVTITSILVNFWNYELFEPNFPIHGECHSIW